MSNIIDDINDSRYRGAELNETEVIINDTEVVVDTSQTQKLPTRENAGKGIALLEPIITGKVYDIIKKQVQFLMKKTKNEVKENKIYDVEVSMKSAVNVIFTQMQDTRGFNLFGERVVVTMIK